jgi:cyclophilin family peptidyl-prolyl cis-trans isomerase/HEAT repeat protein
MRRAFFALAAVALLGAGAGAATLPRPALSPALTKVVDPVIDALWSRFDLKAAADHVRFITGYWRLPGNPGFDATIDRVHARLLASGFRDRVPGAAASPTAPELHIEEYPNPTKGWDHTIGTLAIVRAGRPDEVVLSHDKERIALCINSFSTVPQGVTAKLVDVGKGDQESDYANRDVAGAVVMGDADVAQLWRRAVTGHGAIGVVSGAFGEYVNPDPPGAKPSPRESWDILQWGSIPYDETRKGFGFKATPRAMTSLRKALSGGSATVRVTIASTFSTKPARTLVAEIPGTVAPAERVVVAVHVQEPGANDNGSGVATLAEVVRALAQGMAQGKIAAPGRTLTLLWLDEIIGSRQWLTDHPDQAKNVRYMFSMDMTGEDVRKTGGSFLIERYPDPGAVWDRAWDPHTEWGRGEVRAETLKGDLLNDLHLAVCLRVARKGGWVVNTNPYEGGSDHTVFGTAGIPAVLDWHFTDRYYHTNLDTADKSSAPEMRNVGVAAVSTAWLLASAKEPAAVAIAEVVANAGRARVAFEEREGARLAVGDANPTAARLREDQIVTAWKKWYGEAVLSASRVIVGPASEAFKPKLESLAAPFTDAITKPSGTPLPASAPRGGARIIPAAYVVPAQTGSLESVQLALDRLLADRWYPATAQKSQGLITDEALVRAALGAADPALRRVAVRGLGQFENPDQVPAIEAMLHDSDAYVRARAADALAQSLVHSKGPDVLPASKFLLGQLAIETDGDTRTTIREAVARLHYNNQAEATNVMRIVAQYADAVVLLLRNDRTLGIPDEVRATLRLVARPRNPVNMPSAAAIEALGIAQDPDTELVNYAATWHCPLGPPTCGFEVRYAAVQRMVAGDPAYDAILRIARHDAAFQVRMAAIRRYGAAVSKTKDCTEIASAVGDADEPDVVQVDAISLLSPTCAEPDGLSAKLASLAKQLAPTTPVAEWEIGVPALEALVKFDPDAAKKIVADLALGSEEWQVRAAAARVSTTLRDEATLTLLAADRAPNVQTDALAGLMRLKSAAVQDVALRDLESPDYQLVRQAALALQGNKQIDTVVPAIVDALGRLTKEGKDTSRDPRVPLITRLKDLAPYDSTGTSPLLQWRDRIQPYLSDFDPNIAQLAADTLSTITGTHVVPTPTHRAPQQPTEAELKQLKQQPGHAKIVMEDGGMICTELFRDDAPLTVARFVKLGTAGYYNGLTFHRLVPLFVAQGGSPGANEYTGDARFMRDELSLQRHTRGAVGISTRGRDTGDAQIFFDLIDQPRLNYDYTVFAHVYAPPGECSQSYDVMDRLLPGAKIAQIVFVR